MRVSRRCDHAGVSMRMHMRPFVAPVWQEGVLAAAASLANRVRSHDAGSGRPITAALNAATVATAGGWANWSRVLDLIGINYNQNEWGQVPTLPDVI